MSRVPTEKQYERLRWLGSGAALIVAPRERVWKQCAAHGWIAAEKGETFWRLTPAGIRALADAVERYGWPPFVAAGHTFDLNEAAA